MMATPAAKTKRMQQHSGAPPPPSYYRDSQGAMRQWSGQDWTEHPSRQSQPPVVYTQPCPQACTSLE
jgi:hypothetical protein